MLKEFAKSSDLRELERRVTSLEDMFKSLQNEHQELVEKTEEHTTLISNNKIVIEEHETKLRDLQLEINRLRNLTKQLEDGKLNKEEYEKILAMFSSYENE